MPGPRLSVQLYSVRDHLADLDVTLDRIAGLGLDAVEPFSIYDGPAEFAAALRRHGLTCPTGQAPFLSDEIEFMGRSVRLPPPAVAFDAARAAGIEILIDPMVSPDRWRTRSEVDRTAERLNLAAAEAGDHGLRVGLHNHSFEFHTRIGDVTAYEHLASQLDEAVVLELDIFWAATASQDVPGLLQRLGDRVRAIHVKDGAVPADPFASADGYDPTLLDQRPVGQGEVGVEAILAAASSTEVDVIEFDHFDGDVFAAIGQSADVLKATGRYGAQI